MPEAPQPSEAPTPRVFQQRAEDTIDIEAAMKPRPQGAARQEVEGKRFGKFTIVREIGRGGMGIVYLAVDPDLRRQVALKVLLAGANANDMNIKRFLREARAMSHLNHPHIVPVHEAGQIGKTYFFTMDVIQGRELGELYPKMGVRDRLKICYKVCKALEFAHSENIIHRDLKPANIMVDVHHNPFVMDFGLAKDLDSQSLQSLSGTVLGTPSYMSPEQAQGNVRQLDHRSDIFSVGCILYEMIVGRLAFSGNTVFDTLFAVVNREPEPIRTAVPDIKPDLAVIVERCLEKKPEDRYQDMKAVADDLLRYLRSEGVAAKRVNVGRRGYRWLQQHKPLKIGLLAGLPALVVLVIMLVAFAGGNPILDAARREILSGDPARVGAGLSILGGAVKDGAFTSGEEREAVVRLAQAQLGTGDRTCEDQAATILLALKEPGTPMLLVDKCFHPLEDPARAREILQVIRGFITVGVTPDPALVGQLTPHLVNTDRDPDLRYSLLKFLQPPLVEHDRYLGLLEGILPKRTEETRMRVTGIEGLAAHFGYNTRVMILLGRLGYDDDPAVAAAAQRALQAVRTPETLLVSAGMHGSAGKLAGNLAKLQGTIAERNRLMEELAGEGRPKEEPRTPADVVARTINSDQADERMLACYDLVEHGGRDAQKILTHKLTDPIQDVRRAAAAAIFKLSPRQAPEAARILALIDHAEPGIRANAIHLLGKLEHRPAAAPIAGALATEPDRQVIRRMLEALGRIGDPASLPAMQAVLVAKPDEHGEAVIEAWKAHEAFGGQAYPLLVEATGSATPSIRQAAVAALQELTGEELADQAAWRVWLGKR